MRGSGIYQPGSHVVVEIPIVDATGAKANPTGLPTAILSHDGTDDLAVDVTVTNPKLGKCVAEFDIPEEGYANGEHAALWFYPTVDGIETNDVVWATRLQDAPVTASSLTGITSLLNTINTQTSKWVNISQGLVEMMVHRITGRVRKNNALGTDQTLLKNDGSVAEEWEL
jgi:hypothetical protein